MTKKLLISSKEKQKLLQLLVIGLASNQNMGKCRLCLNFRKRIHSLYDVMEESLGITYADVVASISNVKVSKNDGMPTEICLACCKKLKDIYEFKCRVEKSDIELQKTCQIKKVIFSDIQHIKCKIKMIEKDRKDKNIYNITEEFVKSCEKSLNYNNTIIKRLESPSLSVKEFLESQVSIKRDPDNECVNTYDVSVDYDPEFDDGDDEDYTPIKKNIYNKNKNKAKKGDKGNEISIKPVFLSHVRIERRKIKTLKKLSKDVCLKKRELRKDVCPHCGKMVKCVKLHQLIHQGERKFKCEICSKSYFSKQTLKAHQKCHAKNRDLKCDKCVAVFSRAESLKKHQLIHTGYDRNFPCEICGKRFRRKNQLSIHCQGVHDMGTRNFSCEDCPLSFVTKTNLIHHMRVHTGERPFKCEICSQPYSYRHDFTRHCFKKHGVFLKGRKQIFVMNEEVLVKERALMSDLMLRINGVIKDDKPINPFEGPHAVKAFEQAVKALKAGQIQIDV